MQRKWTWLAVGGAFLLGPGSVAEEGGALRTWTSAKGVETRARMLGIDGRRLRMKLADGRETSVSLSRLSKPDQEFVRAEGWVLPKRWDGWPEDLQVTLAEIRIDELGKVDGWFTYHSEHFEIAAEEALAGPVVKHVARALEGVHELQAESPWGVLATPKNGRFRAELYANRTSYIKNGGPANSAGVYKTRDKIFMIPFESVGLRRTNTGWKSSDRFSMKTLVHELTHMLMDDVLPVIPPWLAEGAADYMELIPMSISIFRPGSIPKELAKYHGFMNSRVTGGAAAPLGEVFRISLRDWQTGNPSRITSYYHAGLLLTYYFIHLDGDGDAARLQRFFAAALHNADRIRAYWKDHEAYREAWLAFKKLPGVKEVRPGEFVHPDHLQPPEAPVHPFGGPRGEPQRFQEYQILLDGRSEETLLSEAVEALKAQELSVRR